MRGRGPGTGGLQGSKGQALEGSTGEGYGMRGRGPGEAQSARVIGGGDQSTAVPCVRGVA